MIALICVFVSLSVCVSLVCGAGEESQSAEVAVIATRGDWAQLNDPATGVYFYNNVTGESAWEAPPGWAEAAEVCLSPHLCFF